MKEWLADAIEQVCLADILAKADDNFGRRFAMIALDNAVEYALICYVEVVKRLVGKQITNKDWAAKKDRFHEILDFVTSVEPQLQIHKDNILRFHKIRNDLYHSGTALTVGKTTVKDYSNIVKDCLNLLGNLNYGKQEWENQTAKVSNVFESQSEKLEAKDVIVYSKNKEIVKFSTTEFPAMPMAIKITIHGFALVEGRPPTNDELHTSLVLSGYSAKNQVVQVKISQARNKGTIQKGKLALTDDGRKEIIKNYTWRIE